MRNLEFELAEDFALYTHKHCFITGKAGTGKTTLLKKVAGQTQKNAIIVAPTGVAAINAGGVTIHSMFGLPLTCFIPNDDYVDPNLATNRHRLRYEHMHFRKDKLRVLRELDTIIIDEISMVRCDLLDAVDFVMRTVRRNERPFGDVQVLLFGDMHQLPPVAKDPEWNILKNYYGSPYFFDSRVWPLLDAAEIELKTVYRQSDQRFLDLLSHIRDRKMTEEDYEQLRRRYIPDFKTSEKGYVLLSTHNYKADTVNSTELGKLPGRSHSFEALIEGDFPENLFPCDRVLNLKVGAQVMFIRNDTEDGKYYNGKLAVVKRILGDDITVTFNDSGDEYMLHRETWENVDYRLDEESGLVEKEELGTFSQYPLRLAWAITIHKSQGLTFDRIIVDAARSFAAGQVYVALSRCRSLEGIVLTSLIPPSALHEDQRISDFTASHHPPEDLRETFSREKSLYANRMLMRLFYFGDLAGLLEDWLALITKKDIPCKQEAAALHEQVSAQVNEICSVAEKFRNQLQRIFAGIDSGQVAPDMIKERCAKAIQYFTDQLAAQIAGPLREHINLLAYQKKVKRYLAHVRLIEDICWNKIERLYNGRFMDQKLYEDTPAHSRDGVARVVSSATSASKEKGGTYRDTLDLYRKGKSIQEIASIRNLTKSTIKIHMARLIEAGEIDVYSLLPPEMIDQVLAFIEAQKSAKAGEIRAGTGNRYDWDDIRMVMSHAARKASSKETSEGGSR